MTRAVLDCSRGGAAAAALTVLLLGPLAVSPAAAGPAIGACCLPDRSCNDLSAVACESAGGSFIGFDSSCASITCNVTSAPLVSGGALLAVTALLALFGVRALRRFRRVR